jgi:hypothetical protein
VIETKDLPSEGLSTAVESSGFCTDRRCRPSVSRSAVEGRPAVLPLWQVFSGWTRGRTPAFNERGLFIAQPQTSVRGWEPAADAQARIVCAVERIVSQAFGNGDLAIVGHGATGTLLYCRLAGRPIDRRYDQPATNGGNWFAFDRASRRLLHYGWRSIMRQHKEVPGTGTAYDSAARRVSATDSSAGRRCC